MVVTNSRYDVAYQKMHQPCTLLPYSETSRYFGQNKQSIMCVFMKRFCRSLYRRREWSEDKPYYVHDWRAASRLSRVCLDAVQDEGRVGRVEQVKSWDQGQFRLLSTVSWFRQRKGKRGWSSGLYGLFSNRYAIMQPGHERGHVGLVELLKKWFDLF